MDTRPTPPNGGPGGPGGPGNPGPFAMRLTPEWSLDFLAPAGVPQKFMHIDPEALTGVLESEHGTQPMRELKFEDGRLCFKALLGSNGDENFIVELKLYMGGVMLGEAFMEGEGKPHSPLVARQLGGQGDGPMQP